MNLSRKWFGVGEINLQEYYRSALSSISRFLLERGPGFLKNVGAMVLDFFLIFITMFFCSSFALGMIIAISLVIAIRCYGKLDRYVVRKIQRDHV